MLKRNLSILLFFLCFIPAFAGNGYKIRIAISGYQDTVLFLTSYYGDKIILVDTATVLKNDSFEFTGKTKLPGGIYMAVSEHKRKLFEFIVDDDQDFSLTTDTVNFAHNMKVKGSEENALFTKYVVYNEKQYRVNRTLQGEINNTQPGTPAYDLLKSRIDSLNKLVSDYKLDIIRSNPGTFPAILFNAMRQIDIPDSVIHASDSAAPYHYYKTHYWDYFDLSDARLLRTPLYEKKVDDYFKQVVVVHPDSVFAAINYLISKAQPDSETVTWLVWHFIAKYEQPEYMGFDKVFVLMVDKYFTDENITNATPSVIEQMHKRAEAIRPLLLGSPAPNLILLDTTGEYSSFLKLPNKYVLLLFWDYDCPVCKKEITELKQIYKKTDLDLEIFAISTNGDLDKWKKTISERQMNWVNVNGTRSVTNDFHDLYDIHGTPAIFILDKNRKIIAKHLTAKQVVPFLEKVEK